MDNAALHEIVMKLIGPVMPVGETHTDDKRFENLEKLLKLIECLVEEEVMPIAMKTDAVEFSIQRACASATRFLGELRHVYFEDQDGDVWQVVTLLDNRGDHQELSWGKRPNKVQRGIIIDWAVAKGIAKVSNLKDGEGFLWL